MSGILATGVHDISYEGGNAYVRYKHKRDVDPVEDGCISSASIAMYTSSSACRLTLNFDTVTGQPTLRLTTAVLTIDSACPPGWLDAEEGTFHAAAVNPGRLTVTEQVPNNTLTGCVDTTLKPSGVIELTASGRAPLTIDLASLTIAGSDFSKGDTAARCPAQ